MPEEDYGSNLRHVYPTEQLHHRQDSRMVLLIFPSFRRASGRRFLAKTDVRRCGTGTVI